MAERIYNKTGQAGFAALAAFLLAIAGGCAAGAYGRLLPDNEVTGMFRSNSVPGNYKYFTDGRSNMPYAIIGMDPDYPFDLKFWEPTTPNTEAFSQKVKSMFHPVILIQPDRASGAWILNSDGKKVGIWYSIYGSTTIQDKDGTVSVLSPFRPVL